MTVLINGTLRDPESFLGAASLADIIVRAAYGPTDELAELDERGKRGKAYDFVDDENLRTADIAELIIRKSGSGDVDRLSAEDAEMSWGAMAEAFAANQRIGADAARTDFGWRPGVPSFRVDPYLQSKVATSIPAAG